MRTVRHDALSRILTHRPQLETDARRFRVALGLPPGATLTGAVILAVMPTLAVVGAGPKGIAMAAKARALAAPGLDTPRVVLVGRDPERAAWQLAAAATGPDDAAELSGVAERRSSRLLAAGDLDWPGG